MKKNEYSSFQYLKPDKDFKVFNLVNQINRVKSKIISLSKTEEERLVTILEKFIVISLHEHIKVYPESGNLREDYKDYKNSGRVFIGYEGLASSGLDIVFEGVESVSFNDPFAWENMIYPLGMYQSDLDHQDFVFVAKRIEDLFKAKREKKKAFILHLEGPPNICSNIDKIDVLYGFGVRCMSLTYSKGTAFCSGLAEKRDKGLRDIGFSAIERMNKLGLAIDIAHASDKSRIETIETSKNPIFITHAGARTLWPSKRLVTDESLHALAEHKGVIGITAAPNTTITMKRRKHTIESVMEHFEYIVNLIGINYVAFGLDSCFGDHVKLQTLYTKKNVKDKETLPFFKKVEFVDGLENPSQFHNTARWLIKNGYSDSEIEKVLGKNIIDTLKKIWYN